MLFNLWGGTINFLFEKTIRIVDTDCEVQMTIKKITHYRSEDCNR